MDNQHREISGYRELSQAEIDLMNEIKALGPQIAALVEKIEGHVDAQYKAALGEDGEPNGDFDRMDAASPYTWVEDGKLSLQKGLMSLTRAVAQPGFF